MTRNSALKKQVRAHMDATGDNYTTARRAVATPHRAPVAEALRPGTVTLAISSGGQTNAALFLPHLVRLAQQGHQLFLAPFERGVGLGLPELLDFVVAAGTVAPGDELSAWDDIEVLRAAGELAFPQPVMSVGTVPAAHLSAELTRSQRENGRAPVLFVQDVQEGGAVTVTPYDDEVAQVTGLSRVAAESGAIIAGGHCMSADAPATWSGPAAAATSTFAIVEAGRYRGGEAERQATLHHYFGDEKVDEFAALLDMSPFAWRDVLVRREWRRNGGERRSSGAEMP